jgi:hypothetical protein
MAKNDFEKSEDERSNRLKRAESPLSRESLDRQDGDVAPEQG